MTAARDLYPLSDQSGKAIPLDIIDPIGLAVFAFENGNATIIDIPDGYSVVYVQATKAVAFKAAADIPDALVDGTNYPNTAFIPEGMPMVMKVTPGPASLLGLGADGTLYMTAVVQWAGLMQVAQTLRG